MPRHSSKSDAGRHAFSSAAGALRKSLTCRRLYRVAPRVSSRHRCDVAPAPRCAALPVRLGWLGLAPTVHTRMP